MSKQELAAGVAAEVMKSLEQNERTIQWLSRKTGIPYTTLRNRLVIRPHTLTIADVILIAAVLGTPITDLIPRPETAAV